MPIPSGLNISFFYNTEPITTPASGNLRASVFEGSTEVINDVVTLQTTTAGGGYRVYVEDLNVVGLVENRVYQFVIYNIANNEVLFEPFCFRYINATDTLVEVSYRNSSDIFNFDYEQIPSFRNNIFLDLNVIDNQGEYDLTQYSEASTGYVRNQKSQLKSFLTLEAYYFDDIAHSGMKGLSMHDDIILNGLPYQVKEGYSIETDIRSSKSKGSIEMYDQTLNEINLNI